MNRAYEEAFAEVDEILKLMPIDLLSKIPVNFRRIISENKAKDYKVEIQEPIEEANIKEETVVILGLIYRDFLASPEEREELQAKDEEELKKNAQEIQLIPYKEKGFLKKIFNFIKGFFSTNKI